MAARRCRTAKGKFRKCGGGATKRRKASKKRTHTKRRKGAAKKGRCLKYSKGRKRCLKRA
jgi:hypothetical protein